MQLFTCSTLPILIWWIKRQNVNMDAFKHGQGRYLPSNWKDKRSGTCGRCCIGAWHTLCEQSPDGSTFLREMTWWPPSWNCNVISEIPLGHWCVFTWSTTLLNSIPIPFETSEPQAFWRRSPQQQEKQQDEQNYKIITADLKISSYHYFITKISFQRANI